MNCLNALWDLGEANVEEVRRTLSAEKPLAYTTVLTLLDRLARRGVATRRREGRTFRYTAAVERDTVRRLALNRFVDLHFERSLAKLRIFLSGADLEAPTAETEVAAAPKSVAAGSE